MVVKKGSAIMVVYTDVDPEHDAEFNAWYNQEHVPERLSAPGFLDCRPLRASAAAPVSGRLRAGISDALHTDEYLRMSRNPTEWSQRMSPNIVGRGTVRNVYTQIYPQKAIPIRWVAAWRPPCKSDEWTCLRTLRTNTTTTTTICVPPPTCKYRVVCTCVATMPLRVRPNTSPCTNSSTKSARNPGLGDPAGSGHDARVHWR